MPSDHTIWMRRALRLAEDAFRHGEVPVGAVIIRTCHADGQPMQPVLLAAAHNQVEQLKDPTAHAEMIAITQAAHAMGDWRLTGTILYVTKEPCPMCAGAIVQARISTVVFGAEDPRHGGAGGVLDLLRHPAWGTSCQVIGGVLAEPCRLQLLRFFSGCRQGIVSRPSERDGPKDQMQINRYGRPF